MRNKIKYLLVLLSLFISTSSLYAETEFEMIADAKESQLDIGEIIFSHIYDSYEWEIFQMGDRTVGFHLPIIIYNTDGGLSMFSSKKFQENNGSYLGYTFNEDGKIILDHKVDENGKIIANGNDTKIYDLSLTKSTLAVLIASVLMLIIFLRVGKSYKKTGSDKAPKGWQNAVESAILFVRDDIAKDSIGKSYMKFTPFLLSLFFFIWLVNMLGLLPGGANVSGNITFTLSLAVVTFIVMLFGSKRSYWAHFFNPPGIPLGVKFLLVPIEIISLIIKPVALTVRLFANMLAGHLVILSFVLLIFIFAEMNTGVGAGFTLVSVGLQVFMLLIKVLVAAIQAFIFANLAAVFIGAMVEDEGSDSKEVAAVS